MLEEEALTMKIATKKVVTERCKRLEALDYRDTVVARDIQSFYATLGIQAPKKVSTPTKRVASAKR